mmetsp:Transcript_27651/g.85425  ORF Transcript_27651/g.85425 Transcript_27651/m.85425 type:complete len:292 (-) Transcript_27651:7467-8342(-)
MRWVQSNCIKRLSTCKGRHYYVSIHERDKWSENRFENAHIVDIRVLFCVLRREFLLQQLHSLVDAANSMYLEMKGKQSTCSKDELHLSTFSDTQAALNTIIALLDQLRVAGVECVESLSAWQKQNRLKCGLVPQHKSSEGNIWIATIESDGNRICGRVAAVHSKFKKYQRAALSPRNARITKFLGLYAGREAAVRAYEAAKPKVALERRTPMNELPPRVEREIMGGVKVIETRGAKPLPQLENVVRQSLYSNDSPPPASIFSMPFYHSSIILASHLVSNTIHSRLRASFKT